MSNFYCFKCDKLQKHCLDKQKVTDVMTEYWDLLINSGNIEMAGAVAVLKTKEVN